MSRKNIRNNCLNSINFVSFDGIIYCLVIGLPSVQENGWKKVKSELKFTTLLNFFMCCVKLSENSQNLCFVYGFYENRFYLNNENHTFDNNVAALILLHHAHT